MSWEGVNGQDEPFKRIYPSPVLLYAKGRACLQFESDK